MSERHLWLARAKHTPYDYMVVKEVMDGPHSTPEGVAEAAKLYRRIFGDEGPFAMVEVHPIPDLDPPIDEDAAGVCRDLIQRGRSER